MAGRVIEAAKFVNFAPGRRGKRSILDCILTVLSHRRPDGSWPTLTLRELQEKASALRKAEVADASLRSVVYRAGLFERAPGQTVQWRLSIAGRGVVQRSEEHTSELQSLR